MTHAFRHAVIIRTKQGYLPEARYEPGPQQWLRWLRKRAPDGSSAGTAAGQTAGGAGKVMAMDMFLQCFFYPRNGECHFNKVMGEWDLELVSFSS